MAETVEGFLDECTSGDYPVKFHKPYWDNISDDAKNFILKALDLNPQKRPTATELLDDPWITSKVCRNADLLPSFKERFDARKKFRDAVEIVKLNNRIRKLRQLYCLGSESDSDLRSNSAVNISNDTLEADLDEKLKLCAISNQDRTLTEQEKLKKSVLTQNAFAQIVKAATKNKQKIYDYRTSHPATPVDNSKENVID